MRKSTRRLPSLTLTAVLLAVMLVTGCTPQAAPTVNPAPSKTATEIPQPTMIPTEAVQLTPTETLEATPTPDSRLNPEEWQEWPIIPELESYAYQVYGLGQQLGRDPHVFSVIGDCQNSPTYFLSLYDEDRYTLPEGEEYLQETIDWYAGSFAHRSVSVENGMTVASALNPYWAQINSELCESTETPIACEARLSNPSLALISLGTNWAPGITQENYIAYLNQIVDILLEQGILPILSTKADNMEGDYSRNLAMAQVAYDRHLPLWNFWATVQDLPNGGLDKEQGAGDEYLTYEGRVTRNRTALELIDSVRRQLGAGE
jgi:hypothetical protein